MIVRPNLVSGPRTYVGLNDSRYSPSADNRYLYFNSTDRKSCLGELISADTVSLQVSSNGRPDGKEISHLQHNRLSRYMISIDESRIRTSESIS